MGQLGQATLGKVPAHGAHHATRQLVLQIGRIERLRPSHRQAFRLGKPRKVGVDFRQRLIVQTHGMPESAQICDNPQRRRI
jgi:hypothetical protein